MFESREGGSFRVSLTHDEPTATGKSAAHTGTYHGRRPRPARHVVPAADNETGTRTALANLARRVAAAPR
ncbi:hypothetical protein [Streptomyces caeruleatus]|uniref:hypothetical protein n=1 Tax=Streptomyces caeruleatus TaxID=661399 RepID=UPI000B03E3BA